MDKKAPVFIIGVPRSGTTLLAAMLAAHTNMSCGPETHFYRWINKVNVSDILDDQFWPDSAVDFVQSIIRRSYTDEAPKPLIEKYNLDKQQIKSYLNKKSPSVAAILSSVTESFMLLSKKTRWVEKTPDHIEYLTEIRRDFPDSRIVRIIRDPRDIALSLNKLPWGVKSFFEGLAYWKKLDDASKDFFATDGNSYTLNFEDLIRCPKEELTRLCEFIGEPFEDRMLDTSQTGKQLNSRNVPWKNKASQPVDMDRIAVWERELSQADNLLAEAYLGDRLAAYSYRQVEKFTHYAAVFPQDLFTPKYSSEFWKIARQGIRFWKISDVEKPDTIVLLGDPADTEWKKEKSVGLLPSRLTLILRILAYKVSTRRIIWVPAVNHQIWSGYSAHFIKLILKKDQLMQDIA